MRNRTFFGIIIGCFIAGLLLAFSVMITAGVGHSQPGTVAPSSK